MSLLSCNINCVYLSESEYVQKQPEAVVQNNEVASTEEPSVRYIGSLKSCSLLNLVPPIVRKIRSLNSFGKPVLAMFCIA